MGSTALSLMELRNLLECQEVAGGLVSDSPSPTTAKVIKSGLSNTAISNLSSMDLITRCATKNDRIRVPEDTLPLLISESLVNQD